MKIQTHYEHARRWTDRALKRFGWWSLFGLYTGIIYFAGGVLNGGGVSDIINRASQLALGTLVGVAFGSGAMKLQRDTLKEDVETLKQHGEVCEEANRRLETRVSELESLVKIGLSKGQMQA